MTTREAILGDDLATLDLPIENVYVDRGNAEPVIEAASEDRRFRDQAEHCRASGSLPSVNTARSGPATSLGSSVPAAVPSS